MVTASNTMSWELDAPSQAQLASPLLLMHGAIQGGWVWKCALAPHSRSTMSPGQALKCFPGQAGRNRRSFGQSRLLPTFSVALALGAGCKYAHTRFLHNSSLMSPSLTNKFKGLSRA